MQARRALLAFAIALLVTAAIALLAAPPAAQRRPAAPAGPLAPAAAPTAAPEQIAIDAGARRPLERTVEPGARFVLTVRAPSPGEVEVTGLGLAAAADAATPASFDALAGSEGRYEVRFTPLGASPRRIATLTVEP